MEYSLRQGGETVSSQVPLTERAQQTRYVRCHRFLCRVAQLLGVASSPATTDTLTTVDAQRKRSEV